MKKKLVILFPIGLFLLVLLCASWKFPLCAEAFIYLFILGIVSLLAYLMYKYIHKGLRKAFKDNLPHLCQTIPFKTIVGILCVLISFEAFYRFTGSIPGIFLARGTRAIFSQIEHIVGYEPPLQENVISSEPPSLEQPDQQESLIDAAENPVAPEQLYAPILEKYRTALSQDYDMGQLRDAGLNYMCAYHDDTSEIGYAFLDVDQNGIPELFIGEISEGDYFFDYYTIIEGTSILVAQSSERDRYYLCADGAIANEGSSSAFDSFSAYYTVGAQGQLILSEAVIYDENYSSDCAWYSTSAISAEGASPLSWERVELIYKKHEYVPIEYVSFFPDGSPKPVAAEPSAMLKREDIDTLLAVEVPPFVATAGENIEIDLQSDDVASIRIPLQSAVPDAFTVTGTVDVLAIKDSNGHWDAETYQKNCKIVYNYADSYDENDRQVRSCYIESEVTVGAGCAMINIMPIDRSSGGSDPTGDTHIAYLDYCTENSPDGAVYVLETAYGDIRVYMDAQMKPIAVRLPADIWSIA